MVTISAVESLEGEFAMAKAMHRGSGVSEKGFSKRMCTNVAWALIAYTMLLIFVVTPQMPHEGMVIWPYFLLVVFVALMVPFCRKIERRWRNLDGSELSDSGLKTRFAIDRTKLWMVAIGVPVLLSLFFRAL